jgi:hypothetical protein
MLIEEARDLSGLTYENLDEAFGFSSGKCYGYSKYPMRPKTRAPQADEIQNLENLVARLLRRPAHIVVIEDRMSPRSAFRLVNVVGEPDLAMDLRKFGEHDLQLGYENDWPTYRRLKYSPQAVIHGIDMVGLWAWQYASYWEREVLTAPWTRQVQGIRDDIPVEKFLPSLVEKVSRERLAFYCSANLPAGILPE